MTTRGQSIKLTEKQLEVLKAANRANQLGASIDLEVGPDTIRYNTEGYTFEKDAHFSVQRNGKFVIPLGPMGDRALIIEMEDFLRKATREGTSKAKRVVQKHLDQTFYYFYDMPRFDRLFLFACQSADARDELIEKYIEIDHLKNCIGELNQSLAATTETLRNLNGGVIQNKTDIGCLSNSFSKSLENVGLLIGYVWRLIGFVDTLSDRLQERGEQLESHHDKFEKQDRIISDLTLRLAAVEKILAEKESNDGKESPPVSSVAPNFEAPVFPSGDDKIAADAQLFVKVLLSYYAAVEALEFPSDDSEQQLMLLDEHYANRFNALRDIVAPSYGKPHKHPLIKAVKAYVSGSGGINKALRAVKGCIDDLAEGEIKDTCRKVMEFLEKLPKHEGVVYRAVGEVSDNEPYYTIKYMAALQVKGAVHREDGFASSSLLSFDQQRGMLGDSVNRAFSSRRCNMIIQSKTGRDIFCVTKDTLHKRDREVLFAPGTEFRVQDSKRIGDQFYFWMEEI